MSADRCCCLTEKGCTVSDPGLAAKEPDETIKNKNRNTIKNLTYVFNLRREVPSSEVNLDSLVLCVPFIPFQSIIIIIYNKLVNRSSSNVVVLVRSASLK